MEREDGKTLYEVERVDGAQTRDILYTPEGKVYEAEEGMRIRNLTGIIKISNRKEGVLHIAREDVQINCATGGAGELRTGMRYPFLITGKRGGDKTMRTTMLVLLVAVASAGLVSLASAQSISDQELFGAASQVSTAALDQSAMMNQDIQATLTSAPQTGKALQEMNTLAETSRKEALLKADGPEGPETEGIAGPDPDGPGGSTHEFDGNETGDH